MNHNPIFPGEMILAPIWVNEVNQEADWIQVGDQGYSVGTAWREPNGPLGGQLPSMNLNAKARANCDYNVCVVYWGTVFMRGLDLSIEDEEARKEEMALIRRGVVKGPRPHILVHNSQLSVNSDANPHYWLSLNYVIDDRIEAPECLGPYKRCKFMADRTAFDLHIKVNRKIWLSHYGLKSTDGIIKE